jgi:hypothetical protein
VAEFGCDQTSKGRDPAKVAIEERRRRRVRTRRNSNAVLIERYRKDLGHPFMDRILLMLIVAGVVFVTLAIIGSFTGWWSPPWT